jgi:hypothetical protein
MFKLDRRIYLILFVLGFVLELAMLTFGRVWPYTLTRGLSTSIYFYDFWAGDAVSKLLAARKLHVILCALSVFSLLVFYWKCRSYENFNYSSFLMVSLKFYFVFFYGFFYVPFSYLYLIPFLYTIALLLKVSFNSNLVRAK